MNFLNFVTALISTWLFGAVSHGGLSKRKRVRAWLLVAALAEKEGRLDGYKVMAFTHPEFAVMER